MKTNNRIWSSQLVLMGFLLFLTISCKKDNESDSGIAIGQSYQGGKIAYILQPGDNGYDSNVQHGLIVAPSDQGTGVPWGSFVTTILGADGTAIGTGNQNTIDIMAAYSTPGTAARLCGDLVLGGYSDWYLPSKDELNQLYLNKDAIGGFATVTYYASSSENSKDYAWGQHLFASGQVRGDLPKDSPSFWVRAVRSF